MKINKPLFFALLIVLILISGTWLFNRSKLLQQPPSNNLATQQLVTEYLQENISALSPEPEVLGGTFYVTNLEFFDDQSVKVEYEDGHIALSAMVRYLIDRNNQITITDFNVLPAPPAPVKEFNEEVVTYSPSQSEIENLVEQYIRENISALSPEPEVLGGTFYVTDLEFLDEQSVKVGYEDGHIALEALANYFLDNGLVMINSFEVID